MIRANAINLSWLIRLRWGAFIGQAATVILVQLVLGIHLPLVPLFAVIALEAASNAACLWWLRKNPQVEELHLAGIMTFDVVMLTVLLYLTGGPSNPFNFLYLVHIALAAVVLEQRYTWPLLALSLSAFGYLFFDHVPLELGEAHDHDPGHIGLHLRGMWVAFGVAGAFVAYFVQRVRKALAMERAAKEKTEKLASLAALAAGAAHELSTPLSTIAVVAKELERAAAHEPVREDAVLIREQVERCRAILEHLAADAGQSAGEPIVKTNVRALVDAAIAEIDPDQRTAIVVELPESPAELEVPPRAVAQALRSVLRNAQQASAPGAPVTVGSTNDNGEIRVEVRDRGSGMSAESLARAGEPFFTTKEPGQGMGLGLFLTRTVLERLGGRLELESAPGRGTKATLVLPKQWSVR